MNEYQQALTRIIELEDKNAELLEALEAAQAWLKGDGVCPYVVKHQVAKAIRKAKGE